MNSRKIAMQKIAKYTLLILCVFAFYILQGVPGFFLAFGVKPVFLIAFCVNLAMLEENTSNLIIYVIAGLLFELSAGRIVGLYTIPLILICISATIAVKFFLKANYRNTCIFSFLAMMIIFSIDFLFSYIMQRQKGILTIYFNTVILTSAYSTFFSPLYYKIICTINEKFKRFDAR